MPGNFDPEVFDLEGWTGEDFLNYFENVVEQHRGVFIFCLLISLRYAAGHVGKGSHTRVIFVAKDHGVEVWETPEKQALTVDFSEAGVVVTPYKFSSGIWTPGRPTVNYSELWTNRITEDQMKNALEEVRKHLLLKGKSQMHVYNQYVILPGKTWGQNCSTYAAKISRKAGFVFFMERLWGANPLHLSRTLGLRKWATHWRMMYRISKPRE